MGIETQVDFKFLTEEQFRQIDYAVMGIAYEIQNEFGRLFDEKVYQREFVDRLSEKLHCEFESPITVSYESFPKSFRMDVVVDRGLICETKVVKAITSEHEAQLLQYMLLCESSRGKVINFGAGSVQGKLISTELNHSCRKRLTFDFEGWREEDVESKTLRSKFVGLIEELGGFLSLSLYYEAITCLLGGSEKTIGLVDVYSQMRRVGHQKCHLLSRETAFKITALTSGTDGYKKQLQKFLSRTDLETIQWINLKHHNVEFNSIVKEE